MQFKEIVNQKLTLRHAEILRTVDWKMRWLNKNKEAFMNLSGLTLDEIEEFVKNPDKMTLQHIVMMEVFLNTSL